MSGWERVAVARYTASVHTLDAPLERPAARSFASRERSSSIASLVWGEHLASDVRRERGQVCVHSDPLATSDTAWHPQHDRARQVAGERRVAVDSCPRSLEVAR